MKFFLSLLFILPITASADQALDKLVEAASKTKHIKTRVKKVERVVINAIEENTPLDKETFTTILSSAAMLGQRKITTKPIKNLHFEFMHGKIRPELEYDFENNTTETMINSSWNF